MHPNHAAFFQFREITRPIGQCSAEHQILTLKIELLHALERANDVQGRSCVVQLELDRLRADAVIRYQEQETRHAELQRRLIDTRRELARSKADGEEQLCALRLEILEREAQCQTLDEICRSLLLTIEQAACLELGPAAPTDPAAAARVSA